MTARTLRRLEQRVNLPARCLVLSPSGKYALLRNPCVRVRAWEQSPGMWEVYHEHEDGSEHESWGIYSGEERAVSAANAFAILRAFSHADGVFPALMVAAYGIYIGAVEAVHIGISARTPEIAETLAHHGEDESPADLADIVATNVEHVPAWLEAVLNQVARATRDNPTQD